MKLIGDVTEVYYRNKALYEAGIRYIVNRGGTSSSKTYSIMQLLTEISCKKPERISVVGKDVPNLMRGAMRDFESILSSSASSYFVKHYSQHKKIAKFKTGGFIEFLSFENEQSAKSGKRDIVFFNEANGVTWPIFDTVDARATTTFIDYNPTGKFWCDSKIAPLTDSRTIHSTYLDNPYRSDSVDAKIAWYKDNDPYRYQVYGLGLLAAPEGIIFPNYQIIDELPDCRRVAYGLDYGYTIDPTALVKVSIDKKDLYIEQLYYGHGINPDNVVTMLKDAGVDKRTPIIADHDKAMNYIIKKGGFAIKQAEKKSGSIVSGINQMLSYSIKTKGKDLINEMDNYTRRKIKGEFINEPIDDFNHAIDAARYAVQFLCRNRRSLDMVGIDHFNNKVYG